jgi:hypothetical protein
MITKNLLRTVCLGCAWILTQSLNAQFAEGTGTSDDPYIITTAEELAAIGSTNGDELYFKLGNDIPVGEWISENDDSDIQENGWIPVAINIKIFHFDGDKHKITGLWIKRTNASLFGAIIPWDATCVTVKNLTIELDETKGLYGPVNGSAVGGLFTSLPSKLTGSVIDNCHVIGDIKAEGDWKGDGRAGLIGGCYAPNTTVKNCSYTGNIQTNTGAGGLFDTFGAGGDDQSTIQNCHVAGNINKGSGLVMDYQSSGTIENCSVETDISNPSGGLIGSISNTGENATVIKDCYYKGTLIGGGSGGLINNIVSGKNSRIEDCHVEATMSGGYSYFGGLVGNSTGSTDLTIKNSYFSGNINNTATNGLTGGLVALFGTGSIINCYASGSIFIANNSISGGLVAQCNSVAEIIESYSLCDVIGPNLVGGLVGIALAPLTINRCYASGKISSNVAGGLVGKYSGDDSNSSSGSIIQECYVTAIVTSPQGQGPAVGGFVGDAGDIEALLIENAFGINQEISNKDVDGFVNKIIGNQPGTPTLTNVMTYQKTLVGRHIWDNGPVNPTEPSTAENCVDKNPREIRTQSTYTALDWDFDEVWTMGNGEYPLPVLKAMALENQPEECPAYLELTKLSWTGGAADNAWNNAANWENLSPPNEEPNTLTPDKNTMVYIPDVDNLPILLGEKENNLCDEIRFKPGAEIGNQHLLTYNIATVEYGNLAGDRWHMLAMPLDDPGIVAGNFYFSDRYTFIKKFVVNDGNQAGWGSERSLTTPLALGEGFAFFAYDELKGENQGETSEPFLGKTVSVTGKLHEETSFAETLSFGDDENYGDSPFALAANPYMATINFGDLYEDNSEVIAENYLIWTGSGFSGYNTELNEPWGIASDMDGSIAPLQSFIVQRAEDNEDVTDLIFNLSGIPVAESAALHPSEGAINRLYITASNPVASVRTFIADREDGQSVLSNSDGRKLFAAISNVPDIYTLKESDEGLTAIGANIIHTDDISIPLGIATTYAENIQLTFEGMDAYDARILLWDNTEQTSIDLTGLESYTYDFTLENAGEPVEDRFNVRILPTLTGIGQPAETAVSAYSKDNAIHVNTSGTIEQVIIYNTQGQAVYTDKQVNAPSFVTHSIAQPGVYVVKVITGNGIKNIKITKK